MTPVWFIAQARRSAGYSLVSRFVPPTRRRRSSYSINCCTCSRSGQLHDAWAEICTPSASLCSLIRPSLPSAAVGSYRGRSHSATDANRLSYPTSAVSRCSSSSGHRFASSSDSFSCPCQMNSGLMRRYFRISCGWLFHFLSSRTLPTDSAPQQAET